MKHLALGVAGRGCEDSLTHPLNYVFPNIFEQSPHVARAVLEAIEALRVPLGAGTMLAYLLPGLFHPARFVRQVYWRMYNNLYVGDPDGLVPFYPRFEHIPNVRTKVLESQEENNPAALRKRQRMQGAASEEDYGEQVRQSYRRTYLELFI